jgi:hypothetical protein
VDKSHRVTVNIETVNTPVFIVCGKFTDTNGRFACTGPREGRKWSAPCVGVGVIDSERGGHFIDNGKSERNQFRFIYSL